VDLSDPLVEGVKAIAITGPNSASLTTLDGLAGKEVFARPSSSYWEQLQALNAKCKGEGKPLVILRAAPENLEDEDILEMLNSGLIQVAVTYVANIYEYYVAYKLAALQQEDRSKALQQLQAKPGN
jgi:hypothetical protein